MHTSLKPSVAVFVALLCAVALAPIPAQSQTVDKPVSKISESGTNPGRKKPAAKNKATERPATAVFDKGSAETTAQRNARLKRECKGGVNAGACSGYTR